MMAATMEQRLEPNPGQTSSLDSYFLRMSLNNSSPSNSHHQHSLQRKVSDLETPVIQITTISPSVGGGSHPSHQQSQLQYQESPSYHLQVPQDAFSSGNIDINSSGGLFLQVPQPDFTRLAGKAVMPQD
jgi:hypothetical protein